MKLLLCGHDDRYAVEQLQMQLFPDEPSQFVTEPFSDDGTVSVLRRGRRWLTAETTMRRGGKAVTVRRKIPLDDETVRLRRRILQQSYYLAWVKLLGKKQPWGAFAGVRPTKLSTRFLRDGGTPEACDKMLRETYFVSPMRSRLCVVCSEHTIDAMRLLRPNDLSLYIGIPFCPTRCAYCSFVSQSVESFGQYLAPYLDALLREIAVSGALIRESGLRVRTVYIGGGTPTTLSAAQMKTLLTAVSAAFDLSECLEFTVEGGRPDTLDAEKLRVIAECGVDRMSINPQTMCDEVLKVIGRRHTAAQVLSAYADAKSAGFRTVNMDMIAGLPNDTIASFEDSLKMITELAPENITVHTLARKKGADLFYGSAALPDGEAVSAMLDITMKLLPKCGYEPYYLYRQKYMSGSFENVGWCKKGHAGLYNIYIMEEAHSILALGSGGMNKVQFSADSLERFHNPKYPQEYIARIDDVLDRKKEIFALLRGQ